MSDNFIWKAQTASWVFTGMVAVLLGFSYLDGLEELFRLWNSSEEYSYGFLIPVIALFLVWQKSDVLRHMEFRGSWAGVGVVVIGFVLFLMGTLGTIYALVHYAFIVTLTGIVLAMVGWKAVGVVWAAPVVLFFMVPLPQFLYNNLSLQLQLISSELGVAVIRLFGISVFLEGNVIDLGNYQLQVVEACNGLRYLFPLTSFAFIAAYFYRASLWKRLVVFASSIPISVLMNSVRIGVIGVMVEHWGTEMAEGFLHDFEGWMVFMVCVGALIAEMWLLTFVGWPRRAFRDSFYIELPAPVVPGVERRARTVPIQFWGAGAVVALAVPLSLGIGEREQVTPGRADFSDFPIRLGQWEGRPDQIEHRYLRSLKLDDYLIADYLDPHRGMVNLYVAYYASQQRSSKAHSPRACIPGGGWVIEDHMATTLEGIESPSGALKVNRLVIQKGESRQLVYYWFQQRGRDLWSEYLVKWFIFWDAFTRNRTDGALVRLTTALAPGEDLAEADERLTTFAALARKELDRYIPGWEIATEG